MYTSTIVIIIAILLFMVSNNFLLSTFQNLGLNFWASEVIIGIIILLVVFLIYKFILKKIFDKK
ncbi:hypothetical protein FC72_GL001103 [Companilactobacillus tucceti DSM 20183]|uniref:Uncharacterized protein n=1 Tax=Companilactobacillus tucceti DSM 20183 TaxID=1423811 RepID=A0A0R1IXZ6_9LACO|nr:hypothetical protein [Companilactobacillus tucceti]KRK63864.1 hypothetical protein FC72_GL001103 [Companilactobacillus tucceti DSM 20183]